MAALKKSAIDDQHASRADGCRTAEFAGYMMPLWFSSIPREHQAVRERAGLFDCTHMGVLEFSGQGAEGFLDAVTTNRVGRLQAGRAQYGFLPDEAGKVIDDLIVYRRAADRFLVVVNASNDEADQAHLREALKSQRSHYHGAVAMRDLRAESSGADRRVNIALQGPASAQVLAAWSGDRVLADRGAGLKSFSFFETQVGAIDVMITRTGYTGAVMCFELLVRPDQAGAVWDGLLARGEGLGVLPCGLGARDSLRIEAGLPLYGHELEGEYGISPFAAGYGWAVKLDKPYFVGREALAERASRDTMQVIRVSFGGGKGVRPLRAGDAMLDGQGRCAGWLTSVAGAGDQQVGLAYVERERFKAGDAIGGYYLARNAQHVSQGRREKVGRGETVTADITGRVLERFGKF